MTLSDLRTLQHFSYSSIKKKVAPAGIRTWVLLNSSQALYQCSYLGSDKCVGQMVISIMCIRKRVSKFIQFFAFLWLFKLTPLFMVRFSNKFGYPTFYYFKEFKNGIIFDLSLKGKKLDRKIIFRSRTENNFPF